MSSIPTITFIQSDGREHIVSANVGDSVMQAATSNLVPGILAECGGVITCGTCHAYLSEETMARVPTPCSDENDILDGLVTRQENSRLTCQIAVTPELDGAVFRLPAVQR